MAKGLSTSEPPIRITYDLPGPSYCVDTTATQQEEIDDTTATQQEHLTVPRETEATPSLFSREVGFASQKVVQDITVATNLEFDVDLSLMPLVPYQSEPAVDDLCLAKPKWRNHDRKVFSETKQHWLPDSGREEIF